MDQTVVNIYEQDSPQFYRPTILCSGYRYYVLSYFQQAPTTITATTPSSRMSAITVRSTVSERKREQVKQNCLLALIEDIEHFRSLG